MKLKSVFTEPEFSRPLSIDKIPPAGLTESLHAKPGELKNLAERFGLVDLSSFHAELTVRPLMDQTIAIAGTFTADVTQTCVVSLESLPTHIKGAIDVLYAAPEQIETQGLSLKPGDKEMEPILDNNIDLGELAAQNLGIALDPYPRKPGLEFVESEYGDPSASKSPLAQLALLNRKPKD